MEHEDLDRLIKEFESMIPDAPAITNSPLEQQGWGPVWAREAVIMAAFKAGVRYPSSRERKGAWQQFLALREMASHRAEPDRQRLQWHSEALRDEIVRIAEGARHSRMDEAPRSDPNPTTVEDMRRLGQVLREAGRLLSVQKGEMFGRHKKECFERIQEIQTTHDDWWSQYRRQVGEQTETGRDGTGGKWAPTRTHDEPGTLSGDDRQRAYEKREQARARTRTILERNRGKLATAQEALERQRGYADGLREKIASARSEEWEERFGLWLSGTMEKMDSIEEWISTLQAWIEEDQGKLDRMR